MSRAVRVPRLTSKQAAIEAEGGSRWWQFRMAGEHGEDGIEKVEGRVQVVVCPWLR